VPGSGCCSARSLPFLLRSIDIAADRAITDHWIAVRAGHLFDGTEKLAANQVILIKGNRIAKVGPADQVQVPADAEVIDLTHATVLPGLIDAHTHVFGNGPDLDNQILRDSYQYRTLTALANAQKGPDGRLHYPARPQDAGRDVQRRGFGATRLTAA